MISQQKFVLKVLLIFLGAAFMALGVGSSIAIGQDDDAAEKTESDSAKKADDQKPVSFEKDLMPVITKKCFDCHCQENDEEGLSFEDFDTVEEVLEKNDHKKSTLYEVLVTDDEDMLMPPPHEDDYEPMTKAEVALVARWIDEGASFTDPVTDETDGKNEAAAGDEETTKEKPEKELDPMPMRIWRFLGSFHPALVHFPIALFAVGAFFVIFCRRNLALANEASFYCLALGSLGAIVASAVGWSLAFEDMFEGKPDNDIWNMSGEMFWHRWAGVIVSVLSVIVWFIAWRQRSEDYADGGGSWKFGLVLLAGLVSYVGYEGGELVHKEGYYFKQLKKYLPEAHEAISPKAEGIEVNAADDDAADGNAADDDDDGADDDDADSKDNKNDDAAKSDVDSSSKESETDGGKKSDGEKSGADTSGADASGDDANDEKDNGSPDSDADA